MRYRSWAPAVLAVPALLLAACASSSAPNTGSGANAMAGSGSGMSSSGSGMSSSGSGMSSSGSGMSSGSPMLEKVKTMIGPVLADSKGYTLYWYSKDTMMTSACTGGCTMAWHPLTGKPALAMGAHLVGKLGTITRSGGVLQATYKGRPLYTYTKDTAPGMTSGNGIAGVWHVIKVTAKGTVVTPMASAMPSPSSTGGMGGSGSGNGSGNGGGSGGGGGYGY